MSRTYRNPTRSGYTYENGTRDGWGAMLDCDKWFIKQENRMRRRLDRGTLSRVRKGSIDMDDAVYVRPRRDVYRWPSW